MSEKIAGLIIVMVVSSSFLWAQDRHRIQAWTVEADTLMNRQDYEGALKLLNKVVKESKLQTEEDYLALYNRAICHFSIGNFDRALTDVNQYLTKYNEQHALMLRLYIYREQDNRELLLKELAQLTSDHPDNVDFIQWRIEILMESEAYALARRDIMKLLSVQPSAELTAYLGMNYYYDNMPDSALTIFDDVLKENPSMQEVYLYSASICIEEEAYVLALQYLERGLKNDPADVKLMFYKGIALVELSKITEGCRCLTKAFQAGEDGAIDYLKEYCYGVD
ncbi:tetratricopeptide repeat protein [Pseudochryseolinea flava]|uniref:Tetratricopeptide repeat protein n=1 Tax=Pseudochryseolinea flava TaxID=2059302 RepID=A0A364Y6M6_9BACT|nr:tetratricopeptide repeat protein [Pseudochryseolinea flava]RAW01875.1 hypothetical protein DQQ10_09550 [Pseudochryseolinea flava]